jgi:hypothetical protein
LENSSLLGFLTNSDRSHVPVLSFINFDTIS